VLTSDNRPAIRAVLWEGVPTLSDSDAKPPVAQADRKPGGGKGGGGNKRGGRESNVGDALKAAYDSTLREDVPPDLLDLLGKLD
jgi:hypothetical protein